MDWICIQQPQDALLPLGVYKCPYCKKSVIVLPEKEENAQPRISNYSYCPHCGTKNRKTRKGKAGANRVTIKTNKNID